MKYLYIDDNPDDLRLAQGDVVGVDNLKDAVRLLEEGGFDAVIIDLRLQGYTGFEVIKVLRKKFDDLKYCITSGHFDESLLGKISKLGVDGFFRKPVDTSKVILSQPSGE